MDVPAYRGGLHANTEACLGRFVIFNKLHVQGASFCGVPILRYSSVHGLSVAVLMQFGISEEGISDFISCSYS